MNQIIELHDSKIAGIGFASGCARINFSHAYIHRSSGRPGIDAGTGWSQRAELIIEQTTETILPNLWPCTILDGILELDGTRRENEIPIPFVHQGKVALKLEVRERGGNLLSLQIIGTNASLKLVGEAEYLEDFSGAR